MEDEIKKGLYKQSRGFMHFMHFVQNTETGQPAKSEVKQNVDKKQ
jgi:hypothetical protein